MLHAHTIVHHHIITSDNKNVNAAGISDNVVFSSYIIESVDSINYM